jgi:hypothetical protein
MSLIGRSASFLALALLLVLSAGCDSRLENKQPLPPNELVAEVEQLDTRYREIHLGPNNSPTRVVGYTTSAVVIYRGREFPVTHLEAGDIVVMQLRQDSRGGFYTEVIRIQESVRDRADARPAPRQQTLGGAVERVDSQRGTFEIRERFGERVVVALPYNARSSDIDRVQRLRPGDYVRLEGRFLSPDRFELVTFL